MKDVTKKFPEGVPKFRNPSLSLPTLGNEGESVNLQGGRLKTIMPSYIFEICTRLEVLLWWKLSGHTNNITEASNLMNEIYKRGEIRNEQQDRNALDKPRTS